MNTVEHFIEIELYRSSIGSFDVQIQTLQEKNPIHFTSNLMGWN